MDSNVGVLHFDHFDTQRLELSTTKFGLAGVKLRARTGHCLCATASCVPPTSASRCVVPSPFFNPHLGVQVRPKYSVKWTCCCNYCFFLNDFGLCFFGAPCDGKKTNQVTLPQQPCGRILFPDCLICGHVWVDAGAGALRKLSDESAGKIFLMSLLFVFPLALTVIGSALGSLSAYPVIVLRLTTMPMPCALVGTGSTCSCPCKSLTLALTSRHVHMHGPESLQVCFSGIEPLPGLEHHQQASNHSLEVPLSTTIVQRIQAHVDVHVFCIDSCRRLSHVSKETC